MNDNVLQDSGADEEQHPIHDVRNMSKSTGEAFPCMVFLMQEEIP